MTSWARSRRSGLRAIAPFRGAPDEPATRAAYKRGVFEAFLRHGGLERDELAGTRVLEVGPGDDLSVALRFLAAGAAEVTCVDRFRFEVDPDWERAVYRVVLEELDEEGRERLGGVIDADGRLERHSDRLRVISDAGIEDAARALEHGSFDLIASVAVLEHVYDLEASMRAMDDLLAAGGRMVHYVDLRDHGMLSAGGHHPLEFLTIPERAYRLMTSHTGAPNRERLSSYRALLRDLGHDAELLVTNVGGATDDLVPYRAELDPERDVGRAMLASIDRLRPRLAPPFASLGTEELAVTGILIRSRKPGVPARGTAVPSR